MQASYSSAGIAIAEMSVRLSDVVSKWTKLALFMVSSLTESAKTSFCKYPVHPEIRKGSPWARAIYETGVGTNWLGI